MRSRFLVAGVLFWMGAAVHLEASAPIVIMAGPSINRTAIYLCNEAQKEIARGEIEKAHGNLDAVIRLDPKFWPAYFSRAKIFNHQHKWDLAIRDCDEVLRLYRTFPEASLLRAVARMGAGRYAEALKEFNYIVDISYPRMNIQAKARAGRAQFYSMCPGASFRNPQQAIKDAQVACNITNWKDEEMTSVLAAAYASAGDFDSAIRYQEKAISLATGSPMASKELQKELALLKKHKIPEIEY